MNKQLQMRYYHALRKTNPALAKTKAGRSVIMKESVWMSSSNSGIYHRNTASLFTFFDQNCFNFYMHKRIQMLCYKKP